MRLIPFDPRFAEEVFIFYYDSSYSHWARGNKRYLTIEECRHLPEIFRSEFLHILIEDKPMGLVTFYEEVEDCYNMSVVLHKDFHRKNLAHSVMDLAEDYGIKKKGARMLMAAFLKKDEWLCRGVEKRGWSKVGELPEYNFVDGQYEDVCIYYKKVR